MKNIFKKQEKQTETPKHIKSKKRKKHSQGLTQKQLIIYVIILIFATVLIFSVIVPAIQGDLHFLTVLSGSMEPSIHMGDIVVSSKTDPNTLQIGDVITYKYDDDPDPNRCITHRIANITQGDSGRGFLTKGDANEEADTRLVKPTEVVGKVVLTLPYMGFLAEFARSRIGFVVFIVIPAALIIGNEVRRIYKIKKEEDAKKKDKIEKKKAKCPECGTEKIYEAHRGEKRLVTCPNCGSRGLVSFEKKKIKKNEN